MNAYDELMAMLEEGEHVEAIVFGDWGGFIDDPFDDEGQPIPPTHRGVPLSLEQARPFMLDWSFNGGFGSPDCHAAYIWTNTHVIWVAEYDGATGLNYAPRAPSVCKPLLSGGH